MMRAIQRAMREAIPVRRTRTPIVRLKRDSFGAMAGRVGCFLLEEVERLRTEGEEEGEGEGRRGAGRGRKAGGRKRIAHSERRPAF